MRPDLWANPAGSVFCLARSPDDSVAMAAAFQGSCTDQAWSMAAGHFINQLRAEGLHSRADALLAVADGGSTCGARLQPPQLCARCSLDGVHG